MKINLLSVAFLGLLALVMQAQTEQFRRQDFGSFAVWQGLSGQVFVERNIGGYIVLAPLQLAPSWDDTNVKTEIEVTVNSHFVIVPTDRKRSAIKSYLEAPKKIVVPPGCVSGIDAFGPHARELGPGYRVVCLLSKQKSIVKLNLIGFELVNDKPVLHWRRKQIELSDYQLRVWKKIVGKHGNADQQ